MSYLDIGYNEYLEKPMQTGEMSALDYDSTVQDGSIENSKVGSISADKITAGTIKVSTYLGSKNILLDGENIQIIINDGTNDRVIIGSI